MDRMIEESGKKVWQTFINHLFRLLAMNGDQLQHVCVFISVFFSYSSIIVSGKEIYFWIAYMVLSVQTYTILMIEKQKRIDDFSVKLKLLEHVFLSLVEVASPIEIHCRIEEIHFVFLLTRALPNGLSNICVNWCSIHRIPIVKNKNAAFFSWRRHQRPSNKRRCRARLDDKKWN